MIKFEMPDNLWPWVEERIEARSLITNLIKNNGPSKDIALSALGYDTPSSNYSAQDSKPGGPIAKKIITVPNWEEKVSSLVQALYKNKETPLLTTLEGHSIKYVGISVASEIAMVLHPDTHCVVNSRTFFAKYYVDYMRDNGKSDKDAYKDSQEVWHEFHSEDLHDLKLLAKSKYSIWQQTCFDVNQVLKSFYHKHLKSVYNDDSIMFFIADVYFSVLYDKLKAIHQ